MAMVTVARLREYLEQVKAGAAIDTKLGNIIADAESIVVEALGFSFFDTDTTWATVAAEQKRVRSEKSKYLRLPAYLIGSIASIYLMDGTTITSSEIESDTYEETEEHFYLYRPAGWAGLRYAVTAKFGYGPVPGAIEQLILELSVNIHRQKDQGSFQVSSGVDTLNNSTGGGFIKYVGGLNSSQMAVLRSVRRKYIEGVH